jgi:hypothetical protein
MLEREVYPREHIISPRSNSVNTRSMLTSDRTALSLWLNAFMTELINNLTSPSGFTPKLL